MSQANVLIVEDDTTLREALCDTLELSGYRVSAAANGVAALQTLEQTDIDMVISDVQMPEMDGHQLLARLKAHHPGLPVVLITAYGTIEKAVQAIRDGAADYVVKPFEAEVLVNTVGRYLGNASADEHTMVAEAPAMQNVCQLAQRVADSDATVFVTGESGTGKEVLARYIHAQSPRAGKPFVAINCAAIPDNMLEATLFGYEKGAFTGAYKACPGKFELAQGGTLLLDEISEMELGLQAKILRVLQEREVERLGGRQLIDLDVRVIATSNRDMRREVAAGRFREDLFYRLNVFPLHIPSLRERRADIAALGTHLLARAAKRCGQPIPTIDANAMEKLIQHNWPGNVRELDNVMQRALILHRGARVCAQDLHFENTVADEQPHVEIEAAGADGLTDELRNQEWRLIVEALRNEHGGRRAVARRLGISERTLRYKLARMREAGVAIPGEVHAQPA